MKNILIPEYKLKRIKNALRLTSNINECSKKETAFDREVMLAIKYINETLNNKENERSIRTKNEKTI
jgi:hypothetical protein